jgi:hypothetical protein
MSNGLSDRKGDNHIPGDRFDRALADLCAEMRAVRRLEERIRQHMCRERGVITVRLANPAAVARLRVAYAAAAVAPTPDWRSAFQVAGVFPDGDGFERVLGEKGQLLVTYRSKRNEARAVVMGDVVFEKRGGVFVGRLPESSAHWLSLVMTPLKFDLGGDTREVVIKE